MTKTTATTLDDLAARAISLAAEGRRTFIAIAGAPGSGKSTTVERLAQRIQAQMPDATAILPMDGFHYDDAVLHARGRHPWKGAPDTFDTGGLLSVLRRLRDANEGSVAVPVFDRDLEISRGSARLIARDTPIILVEGNYLLLNQHPWTDLHPMFDLTVMIDVPEAELARRLRARWNGYGLSAADIQTKLEHNDLPNGRLVATQSIPADLTLTQK
ncbi:nucleoside triphosphate hydrolase [Sagittula sp. SSi028]|uniref:nucleoside triphosphate hydrolase n=1 Tax=Sagittula sp. SSi028 TaxID=3400636 RepID=UPI003AF6BC47